MLDLMQTAAKSPAANLEAALSHADDLFRLAYTLTGSESKAERLVQDCYDNLDLSHPGGMLVRLATRLLSQIRKEQRWAVTFSWLRHDDPVIEAVRHLPLPTAEALLLRDVLDLPISAVATCCGITVEEASQRIASARQSLLQEQNLVASAILEASVSAL
ncbi:MAG: hypothetical protein HY820_33865 [Acidobacteria bacterium]|nr:hypothetical protein [Acidobacteriota bacterium]